MKLFLLAALLPVALYAQELKWSEGIPYDRNADSFEIAGIHDSVVCIENYHKGGLFNKSSVQHFLFNSRDMRLIKQFNLPSSGEKRMFTGTLPMASGFCVLYLKIKDADRLPVLEALPTGISDKPVILWQGTKACEDNQVQAEILHAAEGTDFVAVLTKEAEDVTGLYLLESPGLPNQKALECKLSCSMQEVQLLGASADSSGNTGILLQCGNTGEGLFTPNKPKKVFFYHWSPEKTAVEKIILSDMPRQLLGVALAGANRSVCMYNDLRNNVFRIRGFGVNDSIAASGEENGNDDYAEANEKVAAGIKETENLRMVYATSLKDSMFLLASEQSFSERICQPIPMGMRYSSMQCDNYYYNKNFGFHFLSPKKGSYTYFSAGNSQSTMNDYGVFNSFVCGSRRNRAWMIWQETPEKRGRRNPVMNDPFGADLAMLSYDLQSLTSKRILLQEAAAKGPVIKPKKCRYLPGTGFLLLGVRQGKCYLGTINP